MSTTVTSKGQVTIPKPVRDHLGLVPGSAVDFDLGEDGRVVLLKRGNAPAPGRFDALIGLLGPSPNTDEIMAMIRPRLICTD